MVLRRAAPLCWRGLALAGCYPVMDETINNDEGNPHEEGNDRSNTEEENYDSQWEVHRDTAQEESYGKYWKRKQITKLITECYFV